MPFTAIETQEQLDEIIKDRLARKEDQVRKDYADYDELKAKAERLDKIEEESRGEVEKLSMRNEALSADNQRLKDEIARRDAAAELAKVADQVADEYKVPRGLLRGGDEDELKAHAQQLSEALKTVPAVPVLQFQGVDTKGAKPERGESLRAVMEDFFR